MVLRLRAKGQCDIMQIIEQVCPMCLFIFFLVVKAFMQSLLVQWSSNWPSDPIIFLHTTEDPRDFFALCRLYLERFIILKNKILIINLKIYSY